LKDESGKTVGQGSGFVLINVISPSAKAPFSIPFTVGKTAFKVVEAKLEAVAGGGERSTKLEIADQKGRRVGPIYEVTGSARNPGSTEVTFPKVVATFYDEEGSVVGAETGFVDQDRLGPGQAGRFLMTVSERNKLIRSFTLISEGTIPRQPTT
ncbi:MAG: FxLYD domain-containing protein, partial [Actinomycetota bacterium]